MASSATQTCVNFLVPKTLTWDKLAALWLAIYVQFGRRPSEVPDGSYKVWFEDMAGIPAEVVDIDVRVGYKDTSFGSATEHIAVDANLTDTALPGITHLCTLLGNNNRNGQLKNGPRSLVALIRHLYEAPRNLKYDEYRLWVVNLLLPCIDVYFDACRASLADVTAFENPFLMGSFESMIEIAGGDETKLLARLEKEFEKVKRHKDAVVEKARKYEPAATFSVGIQKSSKTIPCHIIETDDKELAAAYWQTHSKIGVLVVKNRRGNVTIQCSGPQSFDKLYAALNAREPGLWFLDKRPTSPQIHNGSASRAAKPSRIREPDLVAMIRANYEHWLPEDRQ